MGWHPLEVAGAYVMVATWPMWGGDQEDHMGGVQKDHKKGPLGPCADLSSPLTIR